MAQDHHRKHHQQHDRRYERHENDRRVRIIDFYRDGSMQSGVKAHARCPVTINLLNLSGQRLCAVTIKAVEPGKYEIDVLADETKCIESEGYVFDQVLFNVTNRREEDAGQSSSAHTPDNQQPGGGNSDVG